MVGTIAPGLRPTLDQERRLWKSGHEWVAGLDEVGRGAWAGPVSVGVATVRPGCRRTSMPRWLRDSKLLAEEQREAIFDDVAAWCADWAVGHASAEECDRWGMTAALRLAGYRALAALGQCPEALLIDGPYDLLRAPRRANPDDRSVPPERLPVGDGEDAWDLELGEVPRADQARLDLAVETVLPEVVMPRTVVPLVDADARCAAVSAASVLAKVTRDRMMREEAEHFPAYLFERNKGYPSWAHKAALRGYGLSAIHRRSWAFVADLPWGDR